MRKWMRDKLRGRKKKEEDPSSAKPAPLQPAYFESEPGETQPERPSPEAVRQTKTVTAMVPRDAEPRVAESRNAEAAAEGSGAETNDAAPGGSTSQAGTRPSSGTLRPRRRRGRGGRGRKRPAQPIGAAGADSPSAPANAVAATANQAAAAPAALRVSKGVVVLAVGLPGSGKSSWFKRHNVSPLSSDLLRTLLFDDPAEQRFQDLVFSNLRSMLKARLIARRPMNYVDATNLTPQERHNWIKLAKDFGYEVHGVFFDVPLEVCIERHQRRDRIVPEDVMRKMAAKLKAPTFDEGFAKITVVRVKQKPE